MEWEVMYLCNVLGLTIVVAIVLFHLIGVKEAPVADIIEDK